MQKIEMLTFIEFYKVFSIKVVQAKKNHLVWYKILYTSGYWESEKDSL